MRSSSIFTALIGVTLVAAPAAGQQFKMARPQDYAQNTLNAPLNPETFHWRNAEAPRILPRTSTHLCVLSKVSGKFEGYGERVQLTIDAGSSGGPRWRLQGTSGQSQMEAEAICVAKDRFVTPLSKSITAQVDGTVNHNSCQRKDVWKISPYARASFIAGVAGKLAGDGEKVQVADAPNGRSVISVEACSGATEAHVISIGVDDTPMKFRSPTQRTTNPAAATFRHDQYSEKNESWNLPGAGDPFVYVKPDIFLIPVNEGICGLTSVQGRFQGYGESAAIKRARGPDGQEWWTLSMLTQSQGSGVKGEARCISRDQR